MKVLILAAGYGTRLYPLIKDTAKPLLPIAGAPLIDYVVDKLKPLSDLSEIIVVTNNKFYADFVSWAASHNQDHLPITVVNDGTTSPDDRLGAVGDIHFVLKRFKIEEDFFVLGGDNLFDFSLEDYVRFSRAQGSAVTIGLYDIADLVEARKFGVVEVDAKGKVVVFEEKPDNPRSTLIAMCSYYFPKDSVGLVFDYVKSSMKTDKAGDYIRWLTEKTAVFGFKFQGKWYDIGSIETYKLAQEKFKDKS